VDRAHVSRSVRSLLAGLIDYAGLFPPASLAMADAVSRYARYRRGPHAWMLGRFIVPSRRLDDFEQQTRALISVQANADAGLPADADAGASWRLSALPSDDLAVDRVAMDAFNARHHDARDVRAFIDTVEVKVESAQDVRRVADALPEMVTIWFEVAPRTGPSQAPHASSPGSRHGAALGPVLDEIAAVGARAGAKLRTGGVTPDAIPTSATVAHFLLACARAGTACKMTAGLHHAIRAPHRLTYADDSPTALMHGFINVFLAATLARDLASRQHPEAQHPEGEPGADTEILRLLIALLDERDVHNIAWHRDYVAWRGHRIDLDAIAATRSRFARSFGSCSFEEPIDDLKQLGWLQTSQTLGL
jgi:hypothetical protein